MTAEFLTQPKRLDIGCGKSKKAGFIGLDILPFEGVDVIHELNSTPYPFDDSEFDEIWADQVLEHLQHPLNAVMEIWRITKPGGIVHIGVPFFRSRYAIIDPTHRNFFGVQWFDYFDPSSDLCKRYGYSNCHFQIISLEFDREWEGNMSWHHRIMVKYAKRNPVKYEATLSHLYPLNSLTFTLKVIK